MKLSKKLLEYLQNSSNYKYSGWIINNIANLSKTVHIEWCIIKIDTIHITIRQDNFSDYFVTIQDQAHPYICDEDITGTLCLLAEGKLENGEELIDFLKKTEEKR